MFFYCHKINPTTTLETKPFFLLQCNTQKEKLVVNKDGCRVSVMVGLIFHKVCMLLLTIHMHQTFKKKILPTTDTLASVLNTKLEDEKKKNIDR